MKTSTNKRTANKSANIAQWVVRHGLLLFLLMVVITGFFLYQLKNISLSQSLDDIVPSDHPYVKLEKKMFDLFGGSNVVTIGLVVKKDDIFSISTLGKIFRITERLRYLDDVVPYRIVSIASRKLRHVYTYRDPKQPQWLTVSNTGLSTMVYKILEEQRSTDLEFYKQAVINDPGIRGAFVSKNLKGTVIMADFVDEENYRYIFDAIRNITKDEEDSNTTFHLGGRPIMLGYLNLYLKKMMSMFGTAIVVMIFLLCLSFRNVRGTVLPLLAGLTTVIWTLGIMGTFQMRIDMMSLTVPFLILSIAISHSVQIIKRFYECYQSLGDKKGACEQALAGIISPAVTAIITDSAGFGSLMIFPFQIIKSLGLGACLGILTIFFTGIIFVIVILSLLPAPSLNEVAKEEQVGIIGSTLTKLAKFFFKPRYRLGIIVISLAIIVTSAIGASKVVIGDTRPGSPFFWRHAPYNQDDRVLNSDFTGTNPYYILIDSKKRSGIVDPLLTNDIDRLQEIFRRRPEVGYVSSYVDILKKMHVAWQDMNMTYYRLPDNFDTGAELLTDFLGGVEPGVTDSYFDLDMRYAVIQVFLRDHTSSNILGIIDETKRFIKQEKKSSANIVPAAGIVGLFAAIIQEISDKSVWNIVGIAVVILIICAISFRSLVGSLIIFLPLSIGKIISFGVMGFAKIGYFLQTIPAIAPGMGIGVDYSIYVIYRLRDELREHPEDHQTAYVKALSTSGKAVIFTALSVALGVLVLVFSELRFQAIMGIMLAVVIFCNMLGALIVLPAIIFAWKPKFIYPQPPVNRKQIDEQCDC